MNTPDYQDISQENPERIARQEAERAAVRARVLQQKAAIKAKNAEMRPQIEAARAERQAAADRNRAMSENLPLAAIHSGLNQALINQGASPEQRQAALNDLMSVSRSAPRALKGGPDMSALAGLLGKYTTADQMNAALTERGRLGRFNPFGTYNTGVSDAAQRLRDLEAAQTQSRLAIERSYRPQVAQPVQPVMPALPAPVPQPPMMAAPGGSAGFDERTGTYTRPRGPFSSLFNLRFPTSAFARTGGIGGMPPQGSPNALTIARGPVPLDQQGPPLGSPNALTIGRGPVPLDQQGPPLGGGIGAFLGRQGEAPQGGGMPPGVGMLRDQMAAMLNPQPRQGSFVNTMPMAQADPNFRFGQTPQVKAPSAPPMAYKKGGAVKPVWDKKRPDDLGKPKALSVKKKKAAKARAAAAGRPYPNLVDNMAAARKKGK